MEFWGVEVKSGESVPVEPGLGMVLHLSQACLGEIKKDKGSETVSLYLKVDGQKMVLSTLFPDKLPQQQFDLVFEKDFELSHNWKNGSVYFYGYRASNPFDDTDGEDGSETDSDSDAEVDVPAIANNAQAKKGKSSSEVSVATAEKDAAAGKQKVKIVEPPKAESDSSDDDSDEMLGDDSDEDDESDSEDEEDEDENEDEETPKKKVENNKKRPAEPATKTPGPDKKSKTTPQKTDGKKGGHVATPHPAKLTGKTPATNKSNQQTPKSGGSHSCKSCNRSFNSEQALDSHTKAKHSVGK